MPESCHLQDAHLALPHNTTYTPETPELPIRWTPYATRAWQKTVLWLEYEYRAS